MKDPIGVRRRILEAAGEVARLGLQGFTLDAVAAAAGVSKGGLLHHFASKDRLAQALVEQALDQFEAEVDAAAEALTGGGRWLRAYLQVSVRSARGDEDEGLRRVFFAAAALDPSLMVPVRARYKAWREQWADEGDVPVIADVLRFAADGVWWADVFGLAPPSDPARIALLERLEALLGSE